jgi:transcriptional regulator with XRE-family HTH domain
MKTDESEVLHEDFDIKATKMVPRDGETEEDLRRRVENPGAVELRIPTAASIGRRIRDVRMASGLGSRQLAHLIGGHKQLISQLERGEKKWVDITYAMRIANTAAGKGGLRRHSPRDVFEYLTGQVDGITILSFEEWEQYGLSEDQMSYFRQNSTAAA